MAVFTKVEIIALSILKIGKGVISAIAENDQLAKAAEMLYRFKLDSLISAYDWRFCTAILPLSKMVDVPTVDDWSFIYQLPADYLALTRLYPHTHDFQIYENKTLYSNVDELYIEYRFKPDESRFPGYFSELLATIIAYNLANTEAQNAELAKILYSEIQVALNIALASDSQSHPNTSIQSQRYIECRS